MKKSKLVCNLELSKKLAKLGIKQNSNFCWYDFNEKIWSVFLIEDLENNTSLDVGYLIKNKKMFSAFTAGELGIILNKIFKKNPMMDISDKEYIKLVGKAFRFEDEANVRAKMLIHLITKEFIKP